MSELKKLVKRTLRGVATAFTEKDDDQRVVAVQVVDDDTMMLWDNVYHNSLLEVDSVEETEDGLLVKTPTGTWVLRRLSPSREASFKSSMKKAGYAHG